MSYRLNDSSPKVSIRLDEVEKRVATLISNNGITDQAGWESFVAMRFNGTNASGLSAGTRTFCVEFFTKLVQIG